MFASPRDALLMGQVVEPDFEARLDAIARARLGGAITGLRPLTGGASQQLWSFDVETSAGVSGYVLRRAPAGGLSDQLDTVGLDTEAKVISVVHDHGVPVPRVSYTLVDRDRLGTGFIASRLPGESLGRRIVGGGLFAEIRPTLARSFGEILAAIHRTPLAKLPALAVYSPASSIDQLERQMRAFDEQRPVFEAALLWLRDNCPDDSRSTLVHGDFRTGNFLIEPDGITAVLDWEACHVGDPLADLGWLCMPIWRFGHLDRPVGGFGQRAELYDSYERASGVTVDPLRVHFWEVRGILRWGMTAAAMAHAFANGDDTLERGAVGRRASEAELELLNAITGGDLDA